MADPTAPSNAIETERIGSVIVVTFTDSRILDDSRIRDMVRELEGLLGDKVKGVVLDFGPVSFMSSSLLGRLILVSQKCSFRNIELRLCSLSRTVVEIFEIMRLTQLFVIDPDRTASLSKLLPPEGFPFPSSHADWLVCADWWEEQGNESVAQACREEANRCRASRSSRVSD